MVGFCHLTDSHHYHHGQKPTMVGICHGGNMPVGLLGQLWDYILGRDWSQAEHNLSRCSKDQSLGQLWDNKVNIGGTNLCPVGCIWPFLGSVVS